MTQKVSIKTCGHTKSIKNFIELIDTQKARSHFCFYIRAINLTWIWKNIPMPWRTQNLKIQEFITRYKYLKAYL